MTEDGLCFNMVRVMDRVEENTQKMVCVSTWSALWLELR